jgi:hypothetical protein
MPSEFIVLEVFIFDIVFEILKFDIVFEVWPVCIDPSAYSSL